MATSPANADRKSALSSRPAIAHIQPLAASSPHTPQRAFSSNFSSPSVSYRTEEDNLVFEFGSRHFRAGFAGEPAPRCTLTFGPEDSRRVGDYRQWLPGYAERPAKRKRGEDWGRDHELWRADLRGLDLGLIEDKIERVVREAYSKYLLLDSKSRRVLLVLPTSISHALLSKVLHTLFSTFQMPGITLLPQPTLGVVSAGLRSGLVVDIGWMETLVTSVCELREVQQYSTTRAMKEVVLETGKILQQKTSVPKGLEGQPSSQDEQDHSFDVEFAYAEEVTIRLVWCQSFAAAKGHNQNLDDRLSSVRIANDPTDLDPIDNSSNSVSQMVRIPLQLSSSGVAEFLFSTFNEPVEIALFAKDRDLRDLDDHEQPLAYLVYKALLVLPPDIRAICMSRIIITGGGSNIPGLKSRLIEEIAALVNTRGWDPVWGRAADERRRRVKKAKAELDCSAIGALHSLRKTSERPVDQEEEDEENEVQVEAAHEPQVPDPIEEKLHRDALKGQKSTASGVVRGVETLGAWAGGSLIAGLKVKGIVEVEKDTFLQYGLGGAKNDTEVSVVHSRQSLGPSIPRAGVDYKVGWTLGAYA